MQERIYSWEIDVRTERRKRKIGKKKNWKTKTYIRIEKNWQKWNYVVLVDVIFQSKVLPLHLMLQLARMTSTFILWSFLVLGFLPIVSHEYNMHTKWNSRCSHTACSLRLYVYMDEDNKFIWIPIRKHTEWILLHELHASKTKHYRKTTIFDNVAARRCRREKAIERDRRE